MIIASTKVDAFLIKELTQNTWKFTKPNTFVNSGYKLSGRYPASGMIGNNF